MTTWQVGKYLVCPNSTHYEGMALNRWVYREDQRWGPLEETPCGTCHRWGGLATLSAGYGECWACCVDKGKLTQNPREDEVLSWSACASWLYKFFLTRPEPEQMSSQWPFLALINAYILITPIWSSGPADSIFLTPWIYAMEDFRVEKKNHAGYWQNTKT